MSVTKDSSGKIIFHYEGISYMCESGQHSECGGHPHMCKCNCHKEVAQHGNAQR